MYIIIIINLCLLKELAHIGLAKQNIYNKMAYIFIDFSVALSSVLVLLKYTNFRLTQ